MNVSASVTALSAHALVIRVSAVADNAHLTPSGTTRC